MLVQRMAAQTGASLNSAMDGGGHVRTGAMRETLVLMREISRGNWNRVPGSFTLLLQQLGVLSKLTGNQATAAQVLAGAWEQQAAKAGAAAVAATRKAAASLAAFEADLLETDATLNQAAADEIAAAAAIQNMKATQAKAAVAGEAAAAEGAAAGGGLAVIGIGLAALAVVALSVYETFWGLKNALKGMELPELKDDYIPKILRHTSDAANAQRRITDEVKKTIEAYNGAEAAAGRVSKATDSHFNHLRKMAELIKDPATKSAALLKIDNDERNTKLSDKYSEKSNLEIESRRKTAQAANIKVHTAEEDAKDLRDLETRKKAGEEWLSKFGSTSKYIKEGAATLFGGGGGVGLLGIAGNAALGYKERKDKIEASGIGSDAQAQAAIYAYNQRLDAIEQNKIKRKEKEEAQKEAARLAGKANQIGQSIPDIEKANAQTKKDAEEYAAAELANRPHKAIHGSVNNLQKIGAYTTPAMDTMHTANRHLAKIEKNTDHLGLAGHGNPGAVKH